MEIGLKYIPCEASYWDVVRAIAEVLHSPAFCPQGTRKHNFHVELEKSNVSEARNGGSGTLTLPAYDLGHRLIRWAFEEPIRIMNPATNQMKKIKLFKKSDRDPPKRLVATLAKTPFSEPDNEEAHQRKLAELSDHFRIDTVQFGIFYRDRYPANAKDRLVPRSFSVEYTQNLLHDHAGWLKFEYDHKLLRITITNPVVGQIGHSIAISFSSIQKIGVGHDGKPYVCFDTLIPPVLESFQYHRAQTGDRARDEQRYKQRIGGLDESHQAVAAYSPHLRLLFYSYGTDDIIGRFVEMCKAAGISDSIINRSDRPGAPQIEASGRGFFARKVLYRFQQDLKRFPWPVAFQLTALLHNGRLHPEEIISLFPRIQQLCDQRPGDEYAYASDILRRYGDSLKHKDKFPRDSPRACFERIIKKYVPPKTNSATFNCRHVTFTPTRILMEGPYPTQSNRIVRQFSGYEDYFIRVDFRDEDKLQYRWDREVDGASFVRERVGTLLKEGFEVAGRRFEFLAYSSSALREHAVWYMSPFQHTDPKMGWVNAQKIRDSIGSFQGTDLLKMPSKYAARLAQAFTATEASISITRNQWEEVEDLIPKGNPQYIFTDGLGSISTSLGDEIWKQLCLKRRDNGQKTIKPSAYQIRFLGYKGVVAVDDYLDKHGNGIRMRLRKSMRKFGTANDEVAPIEIAQAFQHPNVCYLNRPLVMLLEDLGVSKEAFLELQETEVAEARTIDDNIDRFRSALFKHGLGRPFRLAYIIKSLQDLGVDIKDPTKPNIDTPFLQQVRQVAMVNTLRDMKHSARLLVPDSYLLVGVADEGPAYVEKGFDDVFCLPEGCVYACIQTGWDQEPKWLQGHCTVTRSPVAHVGDLQRVRAIGKPPEGQLCLFSHMKNVLVMASQGDRSLASCLGGGDVDGDLFQILQYEPLMPKSYEEAGVYPPMDPKTLDRESTVDDICDFVVEYINSDLLGLLSDRLLMIADQSSEGMHDDNCKWLAELCSQAVDYPKSGKPVELDNEKLPNTLIRCKPDWHAAEVVSPRKTDYYESSRALGFLYRAITLKEPSSTQPSSVVSQPLCDPISQVLWEPVERWIEDRVNSSSEPIAPEIDACYQRYIDELSYIQSTHTLSNTPGVKLLEAEVVAGTILAKCSQKRSRSDRIYRMRLHTTNAVKEVKNEILQQKEDYTVEELIQGLERAWRTWEFSCQRPILKQPNEEGFHSFGLIALDVILDILERLDPQWKANRNRTFVEEYSSSSDLE